MPLTLRGDGSVSGATFTPTGVVLPYAGTTEPTGWLFCYGQTVSRTTYADLFTALGTTYGAGDGSTTFNVPDMRGRAAAGRDDMGGSAASRLTSSGSGITGTTLGNAGGTETHTLTSTQMPSHTHIQDSHTHANTVGGGATVASSGHRHDFTFGLQDTAWAPTGNCAAMSATSEKYAGAYRYSTGEYQGATAGNNRTTTRNNNIISSASNSGSTTTYYSTGDTQTPSATTTITPTISNVNATATNQNTGGGGAHNNTQPTLILNYIIKAV